MKILRLSTFISLLILSLSMYSQQKLKLAILDPVVTGEKLSDGVGIGVREIVSGTFVNYGDNYSILERSMLDKVMQEANFSNTEAVDESQATRLGKLAGADKVVLTVLSRLDKRCMISIKLINVETATIDQQISKMVDYNSLLDVTEPLTLALMGKEDPGRSNEDSFSEFDSEPETVDDLDQMLDKTSSKNQGIFSIFSRKKSDSNDNKNDNNNNNNDNKNVNSGLSSLPKFNNAGVTFLPVGYDFGYMGDEFNVDKMGQIYDNKQFNVIIDFSDALVLGQNFNDYVEAYQKGDFLNIVKEVDKFVRRINDNFKDKSFGYMPDAPITLVVKIRDVSGNGKTVTGDYVFVNSNTKAIIDGIRLESNGGRGSFGKKIGGALEGDAAQDLQSKLSKILKNYKKQYRKK